jgi:replicative DNA helicase
MNELNRSAGSQDAECRQDALAALPLKLVGLYSIEAEQALLGAILNNQDALLAVDGIITHDDFSEPLHNELFVRFAGTYDAGGRIELGLVRATLGEFGKLPVGDLTISQYVARLAAEATTVINAPDYARTIREMADKRRLIALAETLKSIAAGDQSATTVAIDAIEALDGIISSRPGAVVSRVGIGDAAIAAVERMTFAMQNPDRITGVTWGLHDLDALTGGLQRGDLVVIAGRAPVFFFYKDSNLQVQLGFAGMIRLGGAGAVQIYEAALIKRIIKQEALGGSGNDLFFP